MTKIFQSVDIAMFAIIGSIAFALGMWGYWDCSFTFIPDPAGATKKIPYFSKDAACHLHNWWQMALATLNLVKAGGDFTLSRTPPDPWQLVVAQLAIPAIAVVAAGKLIYDKVRRDAHIMRAGRRRDHVIICGLGSTAMQIAKNFHDANQTQEIVVIDPVGKEVNAATCEKMDIPVLSGDAKNERVLGIAGLRRARSVVVATEDDAGNVDIALKLRDIHAKLPARHRKPMTIFTEVDNDWLFSQLYSQQNRTLGSSEAEIRLVNKYENGARLLIQHMPLPVAPEIRAGALVVIGFGSMGRTVTTQFLSASPTPLGQKMRIIVVDHAIGEAKKAFETHVPAAQEFADFDFIEGDLTANQSEGWAAVAQRIADEPLLAVVTCFGEDLDNLFAGTQMRRMLDARDQFHVPIYVRLQHDNRLGRYAASTEAMVPIVDRLESYGTLEQALSREILVDATIDQLPRALHEAYRRTIAPDRRDAPANRPWAELPEFYKMSNRRACDHLPIRLAQAGLRLEVMPEPARNPGKDEQLAVFELTAEEIDLLARLEHRRWLIERRLLGWQYGQERNEAKRVNPLLVEWEALPDADKKQRLNDAADLPRLLIDGGYVLRRVRRIRAYGDWLATASAFMDELEAAPAVQRYNVVLAEVDRPEGFAIAERAIRTPATSLWLVSRDDPLTVSHSYSGDLAQRFQTLLKHADGWTRRDYLVATRNAKAAA